MSFNKGYYTLYIPQYYIWGYIQRYTTSIGLRVSVDFAMNFEVKTQKT